MNTIALHTKVFVTAVFLKTNPRRSLTPLLHRLTKIRPTHPFADHVIRAQQGDGQPQGGVQSQRVRRSYRLFHAVQRQHRNTRPVECADVAGRGGQRRRQIDHAIHQHEGEKADVEVERLHHKVVFDRL